MKLATLKNGSRDGRLVVVSRDLQRAVDAAPVARTMRDALDDWQRCEPGLQALYDSLQAGQAGGAFAFDPHQAMAPLPRTSQFVDASAFLNHGNIMTEAYKIEIKLTPGVPILVQRQSDDFLGPCDDYPLLAESEDGDFEGEFAVVVDDVPMHCTAEQAQSRIRLVMLLNDVSMRKHLFREIGMGFGVINAKPAPVFGPVAVTPDELGEAWRDGRIHLDMGVWRNGQWFGNPNGREMDWSFGALLAHLAYNRNLCAGTILGSGTVSNVGAREVGSACLAERRALEVIEHGKATTKCLQFGDQLRFDVMGLDGQSVFGAIEHHFVAALTPA